MRKEQPYDAGILAGAVEGIEGSIRDLLKAPAELAQALLKAIKFLFLKDGADAIRDLAKGIATVSEHYPVLLLLGILYLVIAKPF